MRWYRIYLTECFFHDTFFEHKPNDVQRYPPTRVTLDVFSFSHNRASHTHLHTVFPLAPQWRWHPRCTATADALGGVGHHGVLGGDCVDTGVLGGDEFHRRRGGNALELDTTSIVDGARRWVLSSGSRVFWYAYRRSRSFAFPVLSSLCQPAIRMIFSWWRFARVFTTFCLLAQGTRLSAVLSEYINKRGVPGFQIAVKTRFVLCFARFPSITLERTAQFIVSGIPDNVVY